MLNIISTSNFYLPYLPEVFLAVGAWRSVVVKALRY